MAREVERVNNLQTAQLGFPVMIQLAKQVLLAMYKSVDAQAVQVSTELLRLQLVQYWMVDEQGWQKVWFNR